MQNYRKSGIMPPKFVSYKKCRDFYTLQIGLCNLQQIIEIFAHKQISFIYIYPQTN